MHSKPWRVSTASILVVAFAALYAGWMTGLSFRFPETSGFPTYNMLARGFLAGHTSIDARPLADYLSYAGKTFLYFGPGPALFHLPAAALADTDTPTGLVIVLLMAISVAVFYAISTCLESGLKAAPAARLAITLLFALNGYSLLMATIPSIHHEAIVSAMLFLLCGTYLVLQCLRNDGALSSGRAALCGAALCMALVSRFSCALTVVLLGAALLDAVARAPAGAPRRRALAAFAIVAALIAGGFAAVLSYNYLRFGAPFDFGVQYMATLYRSYFVEGHYFRLDHLPHNLSSYLLRLPDFRPVFPYVWLPFYVLEVTSTSSTPDRLLHVNELAVSVVVLVPVLVLGLFASSWLRAGRSEFQRRAAGVLAGSVLLQIIPLSLTVAAAARYYLDFLPFMLLLSYQGFLVTRERWRRGGLWFGFGCFVSLVTSSAVVLNGLPFYARFFEFESPLLRLW